MNWGLVLAWVGSLATAYLVAALAGSATFRCRVFGHDATYTLRGKDGVERTLCSRCGAALKEG